MTTPLVVSTQVPWNEALGFRVNDLGMPMSNANLLSHAFRVIVCDSNSSGYYSYEYLIPNCRLLVLAIIDRTPTQDFQRPVFKEYGYLDA